MKKLKLYGEKRVFLWIKQRGFVAEVFVQDGKIVVQAEDRKLQEELQKEIDIVLKNNSIIHFKSVTEHLPGKRKVHFHAEESIGPEDTDFLKALWQTSFSWHKKNFAGYRIDGGSSRIFDE